MSDELTDEARHLLQQLAELYSADYNDYLVLSRSADDDSPTRVYRHDEPAADNVTLHDENLLDTLESAGYIRRFGKWQQYIQLLDSTRNITDNST
jgi:hypothetical protein